MLASFYVLTKVGPRAPLPPGRGLGYCGSPLVLTSLSLLGVAIAYLAREPLFERLGLWPRSLACGTVGASCSRLCIAIRG